MDKKDLEKICPGCMKNKGDAAVCPHCGYKTVSDRSPQLLPYWTVLNKRFLLGRVLGEPGGFGITYLAWDLQLHTSVAIKEFFPSTNALREPGKTTVRIDGNDNRDVFGEGLKGFLQEARMLAKFSHPNIVRVRDFFEQNNTAYLVMDYYEGVSLTEFVQRNGGRIPDSLAMQLIKPVLLGLKEVHQTGFLHRDIKPANIYITKDGSPVLLDFGSARFAMGEKTTTLSVVLSPGYAPLEQYHQKGNQGPWTDIYSVAATLYFMVTGQVPPNCLERIQHDELEEPVKLNSEIGASFNGAVMKGMSMTESARPQSIDDFYRLLDPQLTVTLSAEELQHVPVSPAAASTRPPAKPKKKTLSALQALILLVMAFAGFMYLMITKPFSGSSAVAEQPVVENPQPQIAVKPDKKEMIPQPQFQSKRQAVVKQEVAQEVRIEEIAKGPGVSDPTKPYRPEQESLAPPASGNASRLPVSGLPAVGGNGSRPKPPEFAIRACVGKGQGAACSINAPHGMLTGECREIQGVVGCIPSGHSRPPGAR